MELKNREDIKNFIIYLEQNFEVNNWKYEDTQIWPVIRIWLYFHLINETESKQENQSQSAHNKTEKSDNKFGIAFHVIRASKFLKWLLKLKKTKFLFVGAAAHRTKLGNTYYNKFYDPLIQKYNLKDFYLLEYKEGVSPIQHQEKSLDFITAYQNYESYIKIKNKFKPKIPKIDLTGYNEFLKFLEDDKLTKGFAEKRNSLFMQKYLNNKFHIQYQFLDLLLDKIKPQNIFMLCYYFDLGMIMMAIANQKEIRTIEVQHGPQTEFHMAYANWSRLPISGYNMLPKYFWCWDQDSAKVFDNWVLDKNTYKVFVGGNPWFDFHQLESDFPIKDYILYTLQPNPVKISELFDENIITSIKKTDKKWMIRFHPRQNNDEIKKIVSLFAEYGIENKVETLLSNTTPLPVLLKNCLVNVTHFSGTIIEAEMYGKPSIILNEIGKQSFESKLERQTAFFVDFKDENFVEKFQEILGRKINIRTSQKIDSAFVDNLFK